jgi:hypothetical protein
MRRRRMRRRKEKEEEGGGGGGRRRRLWWWWWWLRTLFTTKKLSIRRPLGSMMSPAACTASGRTLCTSCAITPVPEATLGSAGSPAWTANSGTYWYRTTRSCCTLRSCSRVSHWKKDGTLLDTKY